MRPGSSLEGSSCKKTIGLWSAGLAEGDAKKRGADRACVQLELWGWQLVRRRCYSRELFAVSSMVTSIRVTRMIVFAVNRDTFIVASVSMRPIAMIRKGYPGFAPAIADEGGANALRLRIRHRNQD